MQTAGGCSAACHGADAGRNGRTQRKEVRAESRIAEGPAGGTGLCRHTPKCGGFSFSTAAGAGAKKECGAGINPFSAFYPGLLSEHQI